MQKSGRGAVFVSYIWLADSAEILEKELKLKNYCETNMSPENKLIDWLIDWLRRVSTACRPALPHNIISGKVFVYPVSGSARAVHGTLTRPRYYGKNHPGENVNLGHQFQMSYVDSEANRRPNWPQKTLPLFSNIEQNKAIMLWLTNKVFLKSPGTPIPKPAAPTSVPGLLRQAL